MISSGLVVVGGLIRSDGQWVMKMNICSNKEVSQVTTTTTITAARLLLPLAPTCVGSCRRVGEEALGHGRLQLGHRETWWQALGKQAAPRRVVKVAERLHRRSHRHPSPSRVLLHRRRELVTKKRELVTKKRELVTKKRELVTSEKRVSDIRKESSLHHKSELVTSEKRVSEIRKES